MSLERLIALAKRTGDRLIVHDPVNDRDMVIMSVDVYEDLLGTSETSFDPTPNSFDDNDDLDWFGDTTTEPDITFMSSSDGISAPKEDGASSWQHMGNIINERYADDWFTPPTAAPASVSSEMTTPVFDGDEHSHAFGSLGDHEEGLDEEMEKEEVSEPIEMVPLRQSAEEEPAINDNGPLATDEPVFYEEQI